MRLCLQPFIDLKDRQIKTENLDLPNWFIESINCHVKDYRYELMKSVDIFHDNIKLH